MTSRYLVARVACVQFAQACAEPFDRFSRSLSFASRHLPRGLKSPIGRPECVKWLYCACYLGLLNMLAVGDGEDVEGQARAISVSVSQAEKMSKMNSRSLPPRLSRTRVGVS